MDGLWSALQVVVTPRDSADQSCGAHDAACSPADQAGMPVFPVLDCDTIPLAVPVSVCDFAPGDVKGCRVV